MKTCSSRPFRFGIIETQKKSGLACKSESYYHKDVFKLTQYRGYPVSDNVIPHLGVDLKKGRSLDEIVECNWCLNLPSRLTQLIRENEAHVSFVGEGEIKTWPTTSLIKGYVTFCNRHLDKKLVNLTPRDLGMQKYASFNKPLIELNFTNSQHVGKPVKPLVVFLFPFFKNEVEAKLKGFITKMTDAFYKNGYNYSSSDVIDGGKTFTTIDDREVVVVSIQFEAKFLENPTQLKDTLFHITTLEKALKIKSGGLSPRDSQQLRTGDETKFSHSPRLYLFNGASKEFIERFITERFASGTICCLKIDAKKLKGWEQFKSGKTLFYVDPVFNQDPSGKTTAVFTSSNIPPQFIEDKMLCYEVEKSKITKVWTRLLSKVTRDEIQQKFKPKEDASENTSKAHDQS